MDTALPEFTMSYDGLVEAGRAVREQADNVQWDEGDLALQVEALPATERPRNPETGEFLADEEKALKRYADDIDVNFTTLKDRRRVAEAWPPASRDARAPWRAYRALASQSDRFNLIRDGMTGREAEKIVRERTAGNTGKPGWFELLGKVGDTLTTADKQLAKAEEAINAEPHPDLLAKADEYAGWANDLAARLRQIGAPVNGDRGPESKAA